MAALRPRDTIASLEQSVLEWARLILVIQIHVYTLYTTSLHVLKQQKMNEKRYSLIRIQCLSAYVLQVLQEGQSL